MINFGDVNTPGLLTISWVLSRIDEHAIFRYYHGPFEIGKVYPSKLRKDRSPSCGFYVSRTGRLYYNDIAKGQNYSCFDFVKELYHCDLIRALEIICNDFGLINPKSSKITPEMRASFDDFDKEFRKTTLIQFTSKSFTKEALHWWKYYEITEEELIANEVYEVDRLFINKQEIYGNKLRFAYPLTYRKDGVTETGVKIYSPTDKNMKWVSTIPNNVPFGLRELQYKSDTVFITKSKKDLITLRKIFPDVIATQNESEQAFDESVQKYLIKNFKKRIIVFDSDETGVENCKKFNSKGFGYFNIPKIEYNKFGIKDPSDYVKIYGIDALKDLFKEKNII